MEYIKNFVSVVIPTHNRAELLPRAINSALLQTYKNIEIVVVSDGSEDNTAEIMKEIVAKNDNVSFIEYYPGLGGNHARNQGILKSKGEWVAFLDDDDEWYETKIEKQMELANQDENIGLVCTGILAIYDSDGSTSIFIPDTPYDASKAILLGKTLGSTTTVMMKHDLLDSCGMFDEALMAKQDYDLWIRACQKTKVGVVKEPCVYYHNLISNNQVSWNYKKYADATEYINKKYEKLFKEKLTEEEWVEVCSNSMYSVARKAMKVDNGKVARQYIYKALRFKKKPVFFLAWVGSFLPISALNRIYNKFYR